MQFTNQADCELAREHLVSLMDNSENVIVNKDKTYCAVSAREQLVFATADEIRQYAKAGTDWTAPNSDQPPPLDFTQKAHNERLENLFSCDEVSGTTPCRFGDIIIEGATEQQADVWQQK